MTVEGRVIAIEGGNGKRENPIGKSPEKLGCPNLRKEGLKEVEQKENRTLEIVLSNHQSSITVVLGLWTGWLIKTLQYRISCKIRIRSELDIYFKGSRSLKGRNLGFIDKLIGAKSCLQCLKSH